jgi:hypothetical protein
VQTLQILALSSLGVSQVDKAVFYRNYILCLMNKTNLDYAGRL